MTSIKKRTAEARHLKMTLNQTDKFLKSHNLQHKQRPSVAISTCLSNDVPNKEAKTATIISFRLHKFKGRVLNSHISHPHITYSIYSDKNARYCPVCLKAKALNGQTRYFAHFTDIILRAPAAYISFHISLCDIEFSHILHLQIFSKSGP